MTFTCVICDDGYLELPGDPAEVAGVCRPCAIEILGSEGYRDALARAAQALGRTRIKKAQVLVRAVDQ